MIPFIIAEAGVNHCGDLDIALQMIDVAAGAGADAVKFQTYQPEQIVTASAAKAEYQTRNTKNAESQLDLLRRLQLDRQSFHELANYCSKKRITFLSTPFDVDSLHFLTDDLDVPLIKIASGELTNGHLLLEAAETGKPIILSTGMADLSDIEAALGVLAFGYIDGGDDPNRGGFEEAYASEEGKKVLLEKVTLLHCTTEYPAPMEEVNLRAMDHMRDVFGLPVGYSDHTLGSEIAIAAVSLGAEVIEKHFTMDRTLSGPDHLASLEPPELVGMISAIRNAASSLGDGIKAPTASENGNAQAARRSLVAARAIKMGERFTSENLTSKRPGTGISPMHYWDWLGRVASRNYAPDEIIES
ncbi:MAG: N-acetylneuraminate synthase [Rhodospirillales bacterium]|nr:N-acetylneuraminate synthase [Rhodospirillales bacterium]